MTTITTESAVECLPGKNDFSYVIVLYVITYCTHIRPSKFRWSENFWLSVAICADTHTHILFTFSCLFCGKVKGQQVILGWPLWGFIYEYYTRSLRNTLSQVVHYQEKPLGGHCCKSEDIERKSPSGKHLESTSHR